MSDLEQLHDLGGQLRPPPFESLVATARRRTRRAAAVLAACTAVVLVIGGGALKAGGDDRSYPAPATPPTTPKTSEASPTPIPERRLEPGTYSVPVRPMGAPQVTVDVPAGFAFESIDGEFSKKPDKLGGGEVAFWNGEEIEVATNFCGRTFAQRSTGSGLTVADLASVLADQPRLNGTDPIPVSVGGYDGLYVELSMPADSFDDCVSGRVLWTTGGARYNILTRDIVLRFWILDVDGHRMMIHAEHYTDATGGQVAELIDIVESTTFTSVEPPEE